MSGDANKSLGQFGGDEFQQIENLLDNTGELERKNSILFFGFTVASVLLVAAVLAIVFLGNTAQNATRTANALAQEVQKLQEENFILKLQIDAGDRIKSELSSTR